MAKLYFRYGAMNSSKSALLLTAAYNYEERDQRPVLVKPGVDTKAGKAVSSRIGITRDVDILLGADESLVARLEQLAPLSEIDAVFVDEAQFLTPAQADEAFTLAVTGGMASTQAQAKPLHWGVGAGLVGAAIVGTAIAASGPGYYYDGYRRCGYGHHRGWRHHRWHNRYWRHRHWRHHRAWRNGYYGRRHYYYRSYARPYYGPTYRRPYAYCIGLCWW